MAPHSGVGGWGFVPSGCRAKPARARRRGILCAPDSKGSAFGRRPQAVKSPVLIIFPTSMIFEHYLMPDLMRESYRDVTPELLLERNIRGLICDIDNTLAPYEQPDPPPELLRWCRAMTDAGIGIAFVSNNNEDRVSRFNKNLGFPAFPDSGKPGSRGLRSAMEALGTDVPSTAMLGDQLLTDAWAGNSLGLYTIIVPPIKDKLTLFFRFKRWLEKPYIREYTRRHLL